MAQPPDERLGAADGAAVGLLVVGDTGAAVVGGTTGAAVVGKSVDGGETGAPVVGGTTGAVVVGESVDGGETGATVEGLPVEGGKAEGVGDVDVIEIPSLAGV